MPLTLYDLSVPVFVKALGNMVAWLDKAAIEGRETDLVGARLAPDMRPLTAQFQMASDTAKNAIGRLVGADAPSMPDDEASFADLRARVARTIAYLESVDPAAIAAADDREIVLKFPNGLGYRWIGRDYLVDFVLPNFFFHVTTAYAILRHAGVELGKPDFLRHLGPPNIDESAQTEAAG